jgi:menaquinone-dependent protoporphyrinogen IX oxidase
MKSIVIYNSQTGFTKKYAEWIRDGAGCDCVSLKEAGKINFADYDAIVFGSWFMAEMLKKLDWFKKQMPEFIQAGKKLIVFAVGASPAESPMVSAAMNRLFTDDEKKHVKLFYCPGGLCYEKMNGFSRFMMKMFTKALASKKDASESDRKNAERLSKSYDGSDKKYIKPILAELK